MKFRVTSVASADTAVVLRPKCVWLEDALNLKLNALIQDAGIDQFVIVFIAVSSDMSENTRFSTSHDAAGKYKDTRNGQIVKFVSVAVLLDPNTLQGLSATKLTATLLNAVKSRIALGLPSASKNFDEARFLATLLPELERL